MKINEVEKRTGITSHNIRFYEKEGLIHPSRNVTNGYREYTEADITLINRIKLLRMLDIPIKEIKVYLKEKEKRFDILNTQLEDLKNEENRIKQNLLLCQEFADMEFDDLSDPVIEQIFRDKDAYVYNLEKIKKQDKINNLFWVIKQRIYFLIGLMTIILIILFYITMCLTYMNPAFYFITFLLSIFLFGCICRIVYYNEKGR